MKNLLNKLEDISTLSLRRSCYLQERTISRNEDFLLYYLADKETEEM